MKNNQNARDVLRLFATYGFRKASMGDIARAANLSRQSIYNRFGSKEAVLDWALTGFLDEVLDSALRTLETTDESPSDALLRAYQAWIGDHVPLLRGTEHGMELLETSLESMARVSRDYESEFESAVARYLVKTGASPSEAADTTLVLKLAAKGLLLKSETSEAFATNMRRVIGVLLK